MRPRGPVTTRQIVFSFVECVLRHEDDHVIMEVDRLTSVANSGLYGDEQRGKNTLLFQVLKCVRDMLSCLAMRPLIIGNRNIALTTVPSGANRKMPEVLWLAFLLLLLFLLLLPLNRKICCSRAYFCSGGD